MNITINRGGKEYEFKYTKEKTSVTKGAASNIVFHKWTCDELTGPDGACEMFFGEYDNQGISADDLKQKAIKFINELPQVKSIVDVEAKADVLEGVVIPEEVVEPMIEEEAKAEATEEEVAAIDETGKDEPKPEEGFFAKLKNKLTNN